MSGWMYVVLLEEDKPKNLMNAERSASHFCFLLVYMMMLPE